MKISYNWLKDYLNIDLTAEKAGEILTDIGLEVEGIEKTQSIEGGLSGLVVGEVKSAEQHPNADRLRVTTVDVGNGEDLQIVCGAPNVAAGQKVIVATVGTMLYPTSGEAFKIKKGKIRGQVSLGMICAEDEIGVGTSHEGIMVLDASIAVGTPAKEVFDIKEDYIIEIGLTPNRSDATCHVGVAKDLAAALRVNHAFEGEVKMPSIADFAIDNNDLEIAVSVENYAACPRYTGLSISNIEVKESPEWLKEKLSAIGVRPISNIVDVTNFILHELGQPLHAFDAEKVTGKQVIVKNLAQDTPFVTLDETERKLQASDLMICNGNSEPMCIGGVFGGIKSGVTAETKHIFLESACFEAIGLRKTSTHHLLRTDAAMRFEKGVDPNGSIFALKRAALLIKEVAGGQISSNIVDIYPQKIEKPQIRVRYKRVETLMGVSISPAEIKNILTALEMDILSEDDASLTVAVPTNKADVLREIDIIEEITRIYGFNNIAFPPQLKTALAYTEKPNKVAVFNRVADFLVSNGFYEIMGTSISNINYYAEENKAVIPLLNSLNADLNSLRNKMLYSGLEVIAHNQNYQNTDLQLFEFGRIYGRFEKDGQQNYTEKQHITLYLTGNKQQESWRNTAEMAYDFFDLKAIVNQVLRMLGLFSNVQAKHLKDETMAYGLKYTARKKELVSFGQVASSVSRKMGIKQKVFYADFQWDTILEFLKHQKTNFKEITKYPKVRRDLALLLDSSINFDKIEQIATKTGRKLLQAVNLFDVYEDEQKLGKGKKSYAVSFVFQDANKTLTDKEIDKMMQKMIANFQKQLSAEIR